MAFRSAKPPARARAKPAPDLLARTSAAEWIAATLGGVLTLAVLGYTVWEGLTADPGPPRLSVTAEPAVATPNGYVVPIVVHNASHATAADVEVRVRLNVSTEDPQERRAHFAYVPGRGEARGGVVFQADPALADVALTVEGYADP